MNFRNDFFFSCCGYDLLVALVIRLCKKHLVLKMENTDKTTKQARQSFSNYEIAKKVS